MVRRGTKRQGQSKRQEEEGKGGKWWNRESLEKNHKAAITRSSTREKTTKNTYRSSNERGTSTREITAEPNRLVG
jgi:hypothetical protein